MPGEMTGWELLEHLKVKASTVSIPVIVVSARSEYHDLRRAHVVGAAVEAIRCVGSTEAIWVMATPLFGFAAPLVHDARDHMLPALIISH